MKDFLKTVLYICIFALICIFIYAASIYKKDDVPVNTDRISSTQSTENKVQNDNIIKKENEPKEEKKEEIVEDDKKEEKENNKNAVSEEVNVSDEQKAIDLAKKEFGITDGVYFNCEKTEANNIYIVSVRDSDTRALAWYTVDVKNGTVK